MKTKPHKYNSDVNVITLGCSKNLVDSENLITQLRAGGLAVEHESESHAPIIVINTCGFIDNAKAESVETILHYADLKSSGKIQQLYVTGCLSERYKYELATEMPEVDAFFGTQDLPKLLSQFNIDYKSELIGERQTTTASHYAYLKISEGCDRPCGFCAIPLMRGKHRSRTIEELVSEAKFLVSRGVKEIILIAQDLTYYGIDLYGSRKLDLLLDRLAEIEDLKWIRLHYAFPSGFPLSVLDCIKKHANICNYLDIPLQHISDNMLQKMRRGINKAKTYELLKIIRDKVPNIAIRTTLMVGYPGETEKDFEELLQFVEDSKIERLGVFCYSHEEGTYAFQFEDNIPEEIKLKRQSQIMELQQNVSFEINKQRIGQTIPILIDRQENGYYIGRTEYDSPEVDNEVLLESIQPLDIGGFYLAHIYDATEFDLWARLSYETIIL